MIYSKLLIRKLTLMLGFIFIISLGQLRLPVVMNYKRESNASLKSRLPGRAANKLSKYLSSPSFLGTRLINTKLFLGSQLYFR